MNDNLDDPITSSFSSDILAKKSDFDKTTTLYENGTNINESIEHSTLTIAIYGTLYTLIFIIGITGNSLVVYVVGAKKSMQSVTNLFIMNLALSDILMCLLAVPFTPIAFFQDTWVLGKFLCHLVSYSLGISVYVSTLTSLAIAIDRYFVIIYPFKPRMKLCVCIMLIGVVWIVSLSISLPLAIYMKLVETKVDGVVKYQCREAWPIPMSKRFFNLASYALQYLIPFAVITFSYTRVWIVLSKRTRPGKTKEKEQEELRRKKRTNRMLVAMVIIFAGCWMPLNCVHLIMEFNESFISYKHFYNVFFTSHVIAMSSTIYNPFLYAWLNENFRKEFRLIIPWIFTSIKWCRKSDSKNDIIIEQENGEAETFVLTKFANQNSTEQIEQECFQIFKNNKKSNINNHNSLKRQKSEIIPNDIKDNNIINLDSNLNENNVLNSNNNYKDDIDNVNCNNNINRENLHKSNSQ